MKIVKVDKEGNRSLYSTFLLMTLVPLFVFGMISAVFVSNRVSETTKKQVVNDLKNIATSVEDAYDVMYPGNYNVLIMSESTTLYKGEQIMSENTVLIDRIKENSGVDISLFFADTRLLTTFEDENGARMVNIAAAPRVVDAVFKGHNEMAYDNVVVATQHYYAYYRPLYSEDGLTCLGMIETAIPTDTVNAEANKAIYIIVGMLILFMLVTAFVIIRSTSDILDIINKILSFLRATAGNNLDARLDELVLGRKDELGEIGIASSKLQTSLKRLIERDALTGLYNRRAGERKLDVLEQQGIPSSISIGDIDFFKKFNDSFGHECGDVVLKEVAAALNEGMTGKGFVARWGGEEFLLVFEGMEEMAAGLELTKILQSVRDRVIEYDGQTHSVTMTFGVVGRAEDEKVSDQIRRADDKLYEGKQGGRNRVIC